jgi:flagellar biosynthetic protein FlhB
LIIAVIGIVLYTSILDFSGNLSSFYTMSVPQSVFYLASSFFSISIKLCLIILAIGVFDFFFQWWQHEKDIKMSKQEIKEEYKMTEGDPAIKSAIRSRQQRLANQRTMQRVPEADVVIVNPVHFAVALKYDPQKDRAPLVIAKGQDFVALKIKEVAAEHHIKIEENPPLARALYWSVKVDQEIPPEFYQAVAEVLSYIFSVKKKR